MWYDIDIFKLGEHLLPPVLRRHRLFALLCVLLLPLRLVASAFKAYRKVCFDKLTVNGRIIYMEKILNDRFFLKHREIYIDDLAEDDLILVKRTEAGYPTVYVGKRLETGFGPVYLRKRSEGRLGGDYTVYVPSFLNKPQYMTAIKNLLDYYRPAGRNYKIKIYEYE